VKETTSNDFDDDIDNRRRQQQQQNKAEVSSSSNDDLAFAGIDTTSNHNNNKKKTAAGWELRETTKQRHSSAIRRTASSNDPIDASLPPAFRSRSVTPRARRYTVGKAERTRRVAQSSGRRNSVLESLSQFGVDDGEADGVTGVPKLENDSDGKKRIVIELGEVPSSLLATLVASK